MNVWRRYGYIWITLGLFLVSLCGHWLLGWWAFVDDQSAHGQQPRLSAYLLTAGRDTLENWQSEFLQLIWQVAGLTLFLCVGSPQSKEGDERREAKLNAILERLGPDGRKSIDEIDRRYPQ